MNWVVKKHKDLSMEEYFSIARLKNLHWAYGIESQIQWMKENIQPEDYHILGLDDAVDEFRLLAYLTIPKIKVTIDGICNEALGIGSVCVNPKLKGTGLGKALIEEAKKIINCEMKKGYLLCKDSLVGFYEKSGWYKLQFKQAIVANNIFNYCVMSLNNNEKCKSILIDRNF